MDYRDILQTHLLSKSNIDFLVDNILANFKISSKAIAKCINIITNNFIKDWNNLDRYPNNDIELTEAVNYLNQKCYNDFIQYLSKKYPDKKLERNPVATTKPVYEEMIIITKDEKNRLIHEQKLNKNNTNDFLEYLTNPLILQMFNNMITQCNVNQIPKTKQSEIIIDEILDINQLKILLAESNEKIIPNVNKIEKVNLFLDKSMDTITKNDNDNDNVNDNANINDKNENINNENEELNQTNNVSSNDLNTHNENNQLTELNITSFDLFNLRKEDLPNVEKRIKELVQQKNQFISEKNEVMVARLEKEKEKIINAVKEYKKKFEKEARDNESKISGMTMSKRTSDDNNIEFLDLQFDPTNDYNDLKNITIGIKTGNKISDITLVDYYVPFNSHNITRFNNKFMVYFNNKVNRIIIPPGKYEIEILLDYIKNQADFLDFSINKDITGNNIITIKNTMNIKFDLMVDKDTIFPLLGFNERQDNYRDKLCYSGSEISNLDCNNKVLFALSGSTIEPLELEFDKNITVNKTLKKSRNGLHLKDMILKFTNSIGQYYDFILPFKMCFKITYVT